jgi:hypothetical protein
VEPQITQNTQMDSDSIRLAQYLNYLPVTGQHLCLLLDFGRPRLETKRIVLAL